MKAHDVLLEHLKQTVTVASATLALTIGFIKDVVGPAGAGTLRAEELVGLSWLLLGATVLAAIYLLATQINNLDSARDFADKAFKAGDSRARAWFTLATFLAFGVGMLLLGVFGWFNYDNILHRKPHEFAVSSATMAIEAAKKATSQTKTIERIASVDLIPGASDSGSSSAVWHVVLETRGAQPSTISPASAPSPTQPVRPPRAAARSRGTRKQPLSSSTPRVDIVATSPAPQRVDYYIDAKTGAVSVQP
ncbi:hypothetical protein [Paraburkholderia guartelaensis]|uniref:hypothetical protein n=1 Tax=Paraburkholderia guartelaensis TaxID=2546446 RepID=UPI002AB680D3|nr:hypothetical protein [Paraburkholderia guartelaensis]